MPGFLGDLIVVMILACAVGLAVRSIWKKRKSGASCCSGDCASCGCCGGHKTKDTL